MTRHVAHVLTLLTALIVSGASACREPRDTARSDTANAVQRDTATAARGSGITSEGWGPLRIGMSRAEVVAALGEDASPNAVGGPDPARCDEFRPLRAPHGMLVMIESGILTRITLTRESDIRTTHGIRTGDSSAKVEEAIRDRLTSRPHHYIAAPARYLTVWDSPPSDSRARGIRFVIDADGRVTLIHAGTRSIEYVEGCV